MAGHLFRARMLTTGQLADLCFDHSENAARHRLYKLKGSIPKNMPKCPRVEGPVWRLTKI